jgi:putative nucleotidyltransferase with HDIG domain
MKFQNEHRFVYQVIDVLTRALEHRDIYTVNHQSTVSVIARMFGQELGLDPFEIEGIRLAGQLHDIGKIAIPADILTKSGRLNFEEYELVKTHVVRGVEILGDIDFPWPIATMVGQHHERMDGSGYPKGLAADEIGLGGRILAVADTCDAVVHSRPYRDGKGIEAVVSIFDEDAGMKYDKDVVAAFHRLLERQDENFMQCMVT